jgi:putative ABC transport system permease protein
MAIMLKFILTSIRERKLRTFLVVFAIALSTALFFASSAMSLTLQDMYLGVMRKYYGLSDIMISPDSPAAWYLSTARAERYRDQLQFVIGTIEGSGIYKPSRTESVSFSVRGFRIEDLPVFAPFALAEQERLEPFTGARIIVSQIAARQYGWRLGDTIRIDAYGAERRFRLVGIALPSGVFQQGFDRSVTGVVPRDYLAGLADIRGKVTTAYVRLRDTAGLAPMIQLLARQYPRCSVREPVSAAEKEQFASGLRTPLMLMTAMVLCMSVFIIYSSFKVITVERMPTLGTFRSIGATRRTTDFVLLLETLLYGVAGGVLGCLLGIGILAVMTNLMAYNAWAGIRMQTQLRFETVHVVSAFLLAVGLSFASAIIPIVRVSKIPVKDIVLGKTNGRARPRPLRVILGLALAAVAAVAPRIVPRSLAFPVDAACILLAIIATIALIPLLTSLLARALQGFNRLLFGNEAVLAAKNLRENRNVLNNISLLALSISSLIFIFTISFSVIRTTIDFYSDARFGLWVYVPGADRAMEPVIRSIPGVSDLSATFIVNNVEVAGSSSRISVLQGVDTRTYLDFWNLDIPRELLGRLEDGRSILLTNAEREMQGVSVGDAVTLTLASGKQRYEVIGFFDSVQNNGSFGLVAQKYLKADAGLRSYSDLYIKTSLPAGETAAALKRKLERRSPWVNTVAEMQENNVRSNQQLLTILEGFAGMTLVMGIFGVLNNFVISFVERRRHLAIFRSVGMSRRQVVRMIFLEALDAGLASGLVGCACGALLLSVGSYLLAAMNLFVTMTFSLPVFLSCMGASVAISLVASVSPALKSSRLPIIASIKYE